jgi:hypothetical protein
MVNNIFLIIFNSSRVLQGDQKVEAMNLSIPKINVREVITPNSTTPPPPPNSTKISVPDTAPSKGIMTAVVVLGAISALLTIVIIVLRLR